MAIGLWAGIECTVNRVGDRYFDQLRRNGHETRLGDLDRFASLGITAIRYPVLWERTAPAGLSTASWEWSDRRLNRLAELGVQPIVGLVHHGSGPPDTSLLHPDFPDRLAEFAQAVARHYPWVTAYTPVNEPLTTARFSGLYGHWYPHGTDERSFIRSLITQCRAVRRSMQAVRAITPSAQLIQTEDAGKTYSTPMLAYQAELENHRRMLSLDLLTGSLSADHPLTRYLTDHGMSEAECEEFSQAVCPPDVLGINYYLTSDRLLDERIDRYPSWSHGGNGRHRYADVSAVHGWSSGITGFGPLLTDWWRRYHIPVAITEAHLGCTREEQLRWLKEAWDDAHEAASQGADVRAVTAWSLLGAYDWNRLVTVDAGWYEPGVFDVRGTSPRPTALAGMLQGLKTSQGFDHPVLNTPGWWRLPKRLQFPPVTSDSETTVSQEPDAPPSSCLPRRPLLIVGANGTLGRAFVRVCGERGLHYLALSRQELDIADGRAVDRLVAEVRPWAVVNTAGYVRVDEAEADSERCLRINTIGAERLASACDRYGVRLVTFSSDLVFDGSRATPYRESDSVSPLNVYGRSKADAEQRVSLILPTALIIRTSAFFGPWDSYNFLSHVLENLKEGRDVRAGGAVVSPTYVPDLVHASLDLLIDGEKGLWHLANQGAVSWCQWARTAAKMAGHDPDRVQECDPSALGLRAARPGYSALGSERGALLTTWESSLERFLQERHHDAAQGRAACV
jgi:dTDP-4-dehydrorhamnose reductase